MRLPPGTALACLGVLGLVGCQRALPSPSPRQPLRWIEPRPQQAPGDVVPEKESADLGPGIPSRLSPEIWSLEQCVNRALEANRGLLDAEANLLSAEYSIAAAESAFELRIFPRAQATTATGPGAQDSTSLGLEAVKQTRLGTRISVQPTLAKVGGAYQGGLIASVNQPLLRGRQREYVESQVDGAEYGWRASRRNLYRQQTETALSTVRAVYRVVQLREALRLNRESADRSEGHVEAARARERAGLSNSLDVYRANLQFNRSKDALNSAEEAFGDAVDTLRLLLALPLTAGLQVDAPLVAEAIQMEPEAALALALAERIELDQAEDDVDESLRRARVAKIDTQPDLDLFLSLAQFGDGQRVEEGLELGSPTLAVGLASSSDLSRTAQRAAFAQARLTVEVTRRRFELQRDNIVREVRRALRDLERDAERVRLQEAQVNQAEGKLKVARIKFERGVASNFDVIEAEEELRSAQISLVGAVVATILDGYTLRAVVGTFLERPAFL